MSAWKEVTTEEGKTYYYNSVTLKTQWQKPADIDGHDPAAVGAAWKEAKADDGRSYYYNTLTNERTWNHPPGFTANTPSAAPSFVAGGVQVNDDEGYRSRDRRRDDRDHGLPQRPNFDGGRAGGAPWEQQRSERQENTGFRGPMPLKVDEPEYPTYEQAEEGFFTTLRKHNVSPDMTWTDALRIVIRDREYRALKDPKERKQAFEKYCLQLREEEKGKEKERREKLRQDFRKMLGTHEDIKHYTRWKTARPSIEREAVFKSAGDEHERRQMFDEYILELKKKHVEDETAKHRSALLDLDALLRALVVDPDTKWNEAQESIESNERFTNDEKFRTLSNVDVLHAFDAHIKELDRVANDTKQREKRMHTRRERQARDGYRQLLHEMQNQGKIKPSTKWKDFYQLIAQDERYLALLGNPGSTPLDLFWDVVEDEDRKIRSLRNDALDVLEEKRYEMSINTSLDDFAEVMRSDPRTSRFSEDEMGLVYERLMEKIKKRAEEDKVHNERHQRKAIDALRSVIKHLEPPVRVTDSYEDVAPRLRDYEEFKVLNDEDAKRSAFEKHIRRLKEKEEEVERDRARHDRDRDHRNGSRRSHDRDHDRRHRIRTPEVDAYEADRRKAQADRERQYRKASFGLTPPPRERRDDRDDRYRRHDRHESMSIYDRERREREVERERSYISRADPRDKERTLDYGDDDTVGSRPGSVRKRRDSDLSAGGKRDAKRLRRTRTPELAPMLKDESPALQSGSEEGEIEEV